MIDNHNSLQMHPLSMEETWVTARWPHCVFCFLLALTVVNIQNGGAISVQFQNWMSSVQGGTLLESSYKTDI